jgi:hypothetical protein
MGQSFKNGSGISRRQLLQTGALTMAACGVGVKSLEAWSADLPLSQPLAEFDYGDVSISSEAHESQLMNTHSVLMALSEDSLLKPFRQMSGMLRQAKTWVVGTRTIPITTIARASMRASLRVAPSDNGCRRWLALMPLPGKRKRVRRYYG